MISMDADDSNPKMGALRSACKQDANEFAGLYVSHRHPACLTLATRLTDTREHTYAQALETRDQEGERHWCDLLALQHAFE